MSVNFSAQDSDVGQVGGGVDLLNSEARHGGAGVWLRGFNNIFQVLGRENLILSSSPIMIMHCMLHSLSTVLHFSASL